MIRTARSHAYNLSSCDLVVVPFCVEAIRGPLLLHSLLVDDRVPLIIASRVRRLRESLHARESGRREHSVLVLEIDQLLVNPGGTIGETDLLTVPRDQSHCRERTVVTPTGLRVDHHKRHVDQVVLGGSDPLVGQHVCRVDGEDAVCCQDGERVIVAGDRVEVVLDDSRVVAVVRGSCGDEFCGYHSFFRYATFGVRCYQIGTFADHLPALRMRE